MSQYEDLRSLLLGREIEAIDALRAEVRRLAKELDDPEAIIERLAPQIDRIIERNIGINRDALVDTLSPIIADVLSHEIKHSGEAIAEALAPVIGRAIRVQIQTQRDEVVDALYPVIGTTVAKFVSQAFRDLLETINEQMQNAFSVTALRRKVKSKVKGIPESELLLQESLGWRVESVFLIHKATGLLLAQRSAEAAEMEEPEMVASMLTAIRSFVNDWISKNSDGAEVNQIDYGDSTIYLEVAGSCYIAVVVKGTLRPRLTERISNVLAEIVEKEGEKIRDFSGDRSQLDLELIGKALEGIFEVRPTESAQKTSGSRWPLYLLAGLLVAAAGYGGYRYYRAETDAAKARELLERYRKDPKLALYRIEPAVTENRVVLAGAVPNETLARQAERIARSVTGIRDVENGLVIAVADTSRLREGLETLRKRLSKALPPPKLRTRIYFAFGSSRVAPEDYDKIDLLGLMMSLYPERRLRLTGYSDLKGDAESRRKIALKRADAVKALLVGAGVGPERIETAGEITLPPDLNVSTYRDEQARRVEAHWFARGRSGD